LSKPIDLINLRPSILEDTSFVFYDKDYQKNIVCNISFTDVRKENEIKYETIKEYRGNGYMQEALRSFADWIFNNTDIKVLYALTNNKDESEPIHSKHGFSKNQFATNEGTWYCIEPCSNNHS